MASRTTVVPQQDKGKAAVGVNKDKKKNVVAAADGRNRRALGDIGNLVTVRGDGKVAPSRPITRGFNAQLLANAQAAGFVDKNKKQVCVNAKEAPAAIPNGAKRGEPKVNKTKKVVPKPKPQPTEVIEISPDTVEKEKIDEKKKEDELVSKKKDRRTLTSTLTARSKAACGVTNKPKEDIVDIDAADLINELAAVEYVEDIYKFYKEVENESRPHNYINSQPEINERMRGILVDWLIEVHHKFELSRETFYLTVNIVDRFLSVMVLPRRELQLLGISATLLASKYEEIWPPEVSDLVCISDRAYSHQQILVMEKTILGKLEWNLTVPTHFVFLSRFIKASIPDKDMENMVYFLAELGMTHYKTIMFCPSMVAASAVYVARCALNKTPSWTDTLRIHTGFSEQQLKDCSEVLVSLHTQAPQNKLQSVYKLYSSPERGAVALFPPAKALLPANSASQ